MGKQQHFKAYHSLLKTANLLLSSVPWGSLQQPNEVGKQRHRWKGSCSMEIWFNFYSTVEVATVDFSFPQQAYAQWKFI